MLNQWRPLNFGGVGLHGVVVVALPLVLISFSTTFSRPFLRALPKPQPPKSCLSSSKDIDPEDVFHTN